MPPLFPLDNYFVGVGTPDKSLHRAVFALALNVAIAELTSLIHDGAVAGYSAPALLQWA